MADEFRKDLRDRIQKSVEQAQEQRQKEMFRKRLDLARSAVGSLVRKKPGEAVRAFFTYLKILEEWKKVPEGGLSPSQFDPKVDIPELLLITGIYWDLVKMFDRTKSEERKKDFVHFLDKFVVFSKGMPYEKVSGETLRKFIAHGKPQHMKELKAAYKVLVPSRCFVVTELRDEILWEDRQALRKFRDDWLKRRRWGRSLVAIYYRKGPGWAARLRKSPRWQRRLAAAAVSAVAHLVGFRAAGHCGQTSGAPRIEGTF